MALKTTELKCFKYNFLDQGVWYRSYSTEISENLHFHSQHKFSSD